MVLKSVLTVKEIHDVGEGCLLSSIPSLGNNEEVAPTST